MGDGRCGVGFVRRLTAVLVALCLSVQVSAETVKAPLVTKGGGARPGVADFRLPEGVSLHSAPGGAHYLKIPVAHALALIRPAVKPRATLMADWATDERFAAVINGGFFIADRPVSLVVRDGETLAENIAAVTRNGVQLPVRRSAFWMGLDGVARAGWVERDAKGALRAFPEPLPYRAGGAEVGQHAAIESGEIIHPRWAIGGGPRLVRAGEVSISFDEEVFWGSGVTLEEARPRSAICVTG